MKNNDVAVIISSCDNFRDAWQPFFKLFFKYWSDCQYKIYLITNHKRYDDPRVTSIRVGEDKQWASNLILGLDKHQYKYIIYLQEDYFIKSKISNNKIGELIEILKIENAAAIRLYPTKKFSRFKKYTNIEIINKGEPYRVSLQATLWNTKVLKNLIQSGETAWDMEISGSKRSDKFNNPFLSVSKPIINYYVTGIVKGKWEYGVHKFLKHEGITIQNSSRETEKYKNYLKRKLRKIPIIGIIFRILFLFTEKYRRVINVQKN